MLPVLGGDVPAAALVGNESGGGGEHHDRAVPARDQLGQQSLRHVQRAYDVDLVHRQPVRWSRALNGVAAHRAAGVVDEDIAALQGLGQRVDGSPVGDVEAMGLGLAAALFDPLRERLDAVAAGTCGMTWAGPAACPAFFAAAAVLRFSTPMVPISLLPEDR